MMEVKQSESWKSWGHDIYVAGQTLDLDGRLKTVNS